MHCSWCAFQRCRSGLFCTRWEVHALHHQRVKLRAYMQANRGLKGSLIHTEKHIPSVYMLREHGFFLFFHQIINTDLCAALFNILGFHFNPREQIFAHYVTVTCCCRHVSAYRHSKYSCIEWISNLSLSLTIYDTWCQAALRLCLPWSYKNSYKIISFPPERFFHRWLSHFLYSYQFFCELL